MIKEILARNNIFNSLINQLLDIKARIYFFVHRNLAYRQLIYTTENIYISIFFISIYKNKMQLCFVLICRIRRSTKYICKKVEGPEL